MAATILQCPFTDVKEVLEELSNIYLLEKDLLLACLLAKFVDLNLV